MLGKRYITIGDLPIPNPNEFSITYENIENVNISESGSDLVNVTKLQKRTWSLSINATSLWRARYLELTRRSQTTLTMNDETVAVRCRIDSERLVQNSELANNTDGLWVINISIMEIG